ncbi:hypothetical protein BG011_007126 [Mortierella polycephala]|uniref:NADH:flavin oxidoreductase/NADH oxidase N-terminal domain-containing protein n=1 Tax=Mortierella polycephala TaxID=41804 RepID=A0A9P6PSS5_9FUNG|nr:hypothetical protein BG011_007126 [Mortierella polycephala]
MLSLLYLLANAGKFAPTDTTRKISSKPTHGSNIHYDIIPSSPSYAQESFHIRPPVAPGTSVGDLETTPLLFKPIIIKGLHMANRVIVAPMCQFSSRDGFMTDYHLVHLGSFAIHGAALVVAEATAVEPRGRISPADTGIWSDDHIPAIKRVADFIHAQGSKMGIQLGHAGRKARSICLRALASTKAPFNPEVFSETEYWPHDVVGPSGGPDFQWDEKHIVPRELSIDEIQEIVKAFGAATVRAEKAGMDTVEIHGAHGYLIHNFLSPISNQRTDKYGGSLENRARFMLEVVKEVCANFPSEKPVILRISASDCVEHLNIPSFDVEQAVQVSKWAKDAGIDIIHVSSAGNTALQKVAYSPGYQVHYAERIRKGVPGVVVAAVGSITNGIQAQEILEQGKADLIAAARVFLKYPSFALEAARELDVPVSYTLQYSAAKSVH